MVHLSPTCGDGWASMPDAMPPRPIPGGMTRECFDPWGYVEFRTNGDVAPCCFRPAIGNFVDTPLSAILNGAAVRRLRAELLSGEMDQFCADCRGRPLIAVDDFHEGVKQRVLAVRLPPGFDAALYLAANPDVAASGMEPTAHFLRYGRLEGRPLYPKLPDTLYMMPFDAVLYLEANPDVAALGTEPLKHFWYIGQFEGRPLRMAGRPASTDNSIPILFQPELYLQANMDIERSGVDPYSHYLNHGQFEGRPLRLPPDPESG